MQESRLDDKKGINSKTPCHRNLSLLAEVAETIPGTKAHYAFYACA